jgi:hypothetical protein
LGRPRTLQILVGLTLAAIAGCGGSSSTSTHSTVTAAQPQSAAATTNANSANIRQQQQAGAKAGQALLRNFNRIPRPSAFALALDFQCFVAASCSAHLPGQPTKPLTPPGRHAAAAVVLQNTGLMQRLVQLHAVPPNVHDVPGVVAFLKKHGVN